jgi:hypothetical protein
MRITLKQLAIFEAVAKHGTVTRAAARAKSDPKRSQYGFIRF